MHVAPVRVRSSLLRVDEAPGRLPLLDAALPAHGNAVETQAIVDQRPGADFARRLAQDLEVQEPGSELLQVFLVAKIGPDRFRRMRDPLLGHLLPGRTLQRREEIGEGLVDGPEPVAAARRQRAARLHLRALQDDAAHLAMQRAYRERRNRHILRNPQRSAQRRGEFAIGRRLRRNPFEDAGRLRIQRMQEHADDVVDVDPAHPLPAGPEPAGGRCAEERQHRRQRAPLPGQDDSGPDDGYAHLRSPPRQRAKFRFPGLDQVGEEAASLRAVGCQRFVGTVAVEADGGSVHERPQVPAVGQRRLDEPSRSEDPRLEDQALPFVRPSSARDRLAGQMDDRVGSVHGLRRDLALVVPFETRRGKRQSAPGAARVADQANERVSASGKRLAHLPADQAGCPGHQDAHDRLSLKPSGTPVPARSASGRAWQTARVKSQRGPASRSRNLGPAGARARRRS